MMRVMAIWCTHRMIQRVREFDDDSSCNYYEKKEGNWMSIKHHQIGDIRDLLGLEDGDGDADSCWSKSIAIVYHLNGIVIFDRSVYFELNESYRESYLDNCNEVLLDEDMSSENYDLRW